MPDLFLNLSERLNQLADRILELLTGSAEYTAVKERARVPDIRRIIHSSMAERLPPSGGDFRDW